ncbi:MAG: sulfatase [Verrucomicrobiales bacterium]|nr:sulfatase [Verrucomicrobiales bacterium]
MMRKAWRYFVGGFFLLLALQGLRVEVVAEENSKRPNIVFAFADDWGRYASAYAKVDKVVGPNAIIQTPHFDRVAKEGVLFTNAFVTSPSCTPCRSSLLSGQYFFRTGLGAILVGAEWDAKIPSFPLLLKKSGYHIGQTYKVWSPGKPNDAPYGERKYEYESAGRKFNTFSQNVTRMMDEGGKTMQEAKQVLYDEVTGNFDLFLEDRENKEQPFCYWFGPTNVHRKWIKGSGKRLWGLNPDDLKGAMPEFVPDVPVVREDFADYLGEAMAFDAALGLLLDKLEAIGELENTIVVVSGDHGTPGFTHGKTNLYDFGTGVPLAIRWPAKVPAGRVVKDFVNLMDLAPTFLEAGITKIPEVMTGKSLVNVLTSKKDGWVDPSRDFVVTGRERHVGMARTGNLPYPQRAIRTKDFLYIRNFKPDRWPQGNPYGLSEGKQPSKEDLIEDTRATFPDMDSSPTKAWLVMNRDNVSAQGPKYFDWAFAKRPGEELYDLREDPDQLKNLADESGYAEVREKLSTRLMGILKDAKDPRVMGDGSTFDKAPYTNLGKPRKKKKKK